MDTQASETPSYEGTPYEDSADASADILRDIHAEHRQVFKALRVFEKFAAAFDRGEKSMSLEPVQILLDYLAGPFDKIHHEKEDLLYTELTKGHGVDAEELRKAAAQHEAIAQLNVTANRLVAELRSGEDVDLAALSGALRHLAGAQARHMLLEENQLLPLAQSVLKPEEIAIFSKRAAFMGKPLLPPTYLADNDVESEVIGVTTHA